MGKRPDLVAAATRMLEETGEPPSAAEADLIQKTSEQEVIWAQTFPALLTRRSLKIHAEAIVASSKAAEKHARTLARATVALAVVTFFLAVATAALVWVTAAEKERASEARAVTAPTNDPTGPPTGPTQPKTNP